MNKTVELKETDASKSISKELEEVIFLIDFPKKKVYVGSRLSPELKYKFIKFCHANAYYFAWSHANMAGFPLPPKVIAHKLNIDPNYWTVKQKKHKQGSHRNEVTNNKISKLLKIDLIR